MHILYVSQKGGGHDTYVMKMARALEGCGHRVTVLYIELSWRHVVFEHKGGMTLVLCGLPGVHYYASKLFPSHGAMVKALRGYEYRILLLYMVKQIHKREAIDIIELPEVVFYDKMKRIAPVVVHLHSMDWVWQKYADGIKIGSGDRRLLEQRRIVNAASAIRTPSKSLADIVRRDCGLSFKYVQIPYPMDPCIQSQGRTCKTEKIVLFVGRVETRKGGDTAIRAFKTVREYHHDATLVMAGHVLGSIRELCSGTGDDGVVLLGPVAPADLCEWYSRATVVVVPSLWDNSPNVVYEAMGHGCPVIGANVGGIPELIDEGITGSLVKPGSHAELSAAIVRLLSDQALAQRMGQAGYRKCQDHYSTDVVLGKSLDFYSSVISPGKGAHDALVD